MDKVQLLHGTVKITKMEIAMKRFLNYIVLAAVAAVLVLVSGCINDIEPENLNPEENGSYTLTLQFCKQDDLTKALEFYGDGSKLISYWDATDVIEVYKKDGTPIGSLYPVNFTSSSNKLTFSGTVSNVAVGDKLLFYLNKDADYH